MYTSKNLTTNQAAIASKPAPTVNRGTSGEKGRLSGRHRRQASSHNLIWVHPPEMAHCQTAIASKPNACCPHSDTAT
jgi:hypothetical protein